MRLNEVIVVIVITFHAGGILDANTDGVKCGNTKNVSHCSCRVECVSYVFNLAYATKL